ncbi:MAG: hypothetical protein RIG63_22865 [Coleofasciculus chthonoplastes F3-SA18-01]|uniref:hypothetical protein n=1 Tax=Coleofasciculus chthonoplastes TaxID=64178 RepID=UPI0032F14BAE
MTRQPHDQFAKQYLEELLAPLGTVETSRDVPSEVRQIDVWFIPAPSPSPEFETLGLLGKMAATTCLFEPFRNAPTPVEVRSCMLKLYSVEAELLRKARRERRSLSEDESPRLWILSPSCSQRLLDGFCAKLNQSENWGEGVYFLPEFQRTALVAINQLPINQDTLWLRVLGKRRTQQQAIDELIGLPQENPQRRNILEILANWRINVGRSERLSNADRELIMNLSPAYVKWREEAVLEGKLEERRQIVENSLRVRFGELNEELEAIIAPMLQLPPEVLTRLLFSLSKQELLLWFGEGSGQDLRLGEGKREKVENLLRVRFGEVDAELADKIAAMLQLPHQQLTPLLLTRSREELLERFGR